MCDETEMAHQKEIEELRNEILQLNKDLEEKDQNLRVAGEFGNKLLEDNSDLNNKIDEITNFYVQKIEILEQEKHTLKNKIEQEIKTHASHAYDLEIAKEKILRESEAEEERREADYDKEMNKLKLQIESLETEAEKQQLIEKQSQAKIERLEESLLAVKKSQKELEMMNSLESDLIEIQEAYYQVKAERDSLASDVNDLKDIIQQHEFDMESLKQSLEVVREQLNEKSDQASSWFDCLQETRQDLAEAQAQLQHLKMEAESSSFKKKGNSLFGELEDKRVEAENKFISLQVKYESLQKLYNISKQQLHKLKCQVAALFQMSGGKADVSKIRTLEEALSQSQDEVQMLLSKLQKLEKLEAEYDQSSKLQQFHGAFTDFGDKKDYVELLQKQLQDTKNTIISLKKEIQTKTLLQLGERDRLRETERLLYSSDSKAEKLQSENMKLRLKLDGLRLKLQKQQNEKSATTQAAVIHDSATLNVTKRNHRKDQKPDKSINCRDDSTKANGCDKSKFTLRWEKLPSFAAKKAQEEPKCDTNKEENTELENTQDMDVLPTSNASLVQSNESTFENELSVLDPVFSHVQDEEQNEEIPVKSRKPSKVRFNIEDENVDVRNLEKSDQELTATEHVSATSNKVATIPSSGHLPSSRTNTVRINVKKDEARPNECKQQ